MVVLEKGCPRQAKRTHEGRRRRRSLEKLEEIASVLVVQEEAGVVVLVAEVLLELNTLDLKERVKRILKGLVRLSLVVTRLVHEVVLTAGHSDARVEH